MAAAALVLTSGALAQTLVADGGFGAQPMRSCQSDLQYLNQVTGWQNHWPSLWQAVRSAGPEERAKAIKHWSAAPEILLATIDALRGSIGTPRAAPAVVVLRVAEQTDNLAAALDARDPRYFDDEAKDAEWNAMLATVIAPAIRDYSSFLRNEYLPGAAEAVGLFALADGAACFDRAIAWWTSLAKPAGDVEAIGRRLLGETRAALAETLAPGETIEHALDNLRQSCGQKETTREDIVRISEGALDRAERALPAWFARSPTAPIVVAPLSRHMEGAYPAGYYRPAEDPEANGVAAYVVNTSRPLDRRAMAEAIAFHEGLPGHHLHATYPREGSLGGFNAGTMEGWAIYAEYLADEMGLYADLCGRQGMMAKHLWAASRLIVEPGMHLRGWTREQAVAFMLETTALSRQEVEIEVDRYIAMPGQSLSYMLGYDVIASARAKAERALGERFDIREFHDRVLAPPVRDLPTLRTDLQRWIEDSAR